MKKYISIILRLFIAVILVQTLRFKFSAHPDSVFIFSEVRLEPIGRIAIGILELLAAILILLPRTIWIGAAMTIVIISGAILIHLTLIGIEVKGDNGMLFYTAIATFLLSTVILWMERKTIPSQIIKEWISRLGI